VRDDGIGALATKTVGQMIDTIRAVDQTWD
jgi:hypothetical protein